MAGLNVKRPTRAMNDASTGGQKPPVRGLGVVVERNEYYRDGYRVLLSVSIMQAMVIVILLLLMFYVVHVNQKENVYFATREDGSLIQMVPVTDPNLSTAAVTAWAAQAATEVMTFGPSDYRRRLQESSRNFTRLGWQNFVTALEKSGTFDAITGRLQNITAAPAGAPVITEEGTKIGPNGRPRYEWRVELPLVVTFEGGGARRSDRLIVNMLIVRVPTLESPNGIGIEQWVARNQN